MKLNDVKLPAAKPREKAYKLTDGKRLLLFVTSSGSKSWRLKYCFGGKEKLLFCYKVGADRCVGPNNVFLTRMKKAHLMPPRIRS
jgi:hypothetical protein